jgi:hypothetical protein
MTLDLIIKGSYIKFKWGLRVNNIVVEYIKGVVNL